MWQFLRNLFRIIFGNRFVLRKIKKDAQKEVASEKESGGMDHVRKSSSAWFRRNR